MCTCPAGTHPLTVQDREVQGRAGQDRTGQVYGNGKERKRERVQGG